MPTLVDHLSFRLAFGPARREALRNAGLCALFIAGFGIVGEMDYREALRAEAEAHENRADLNRAALLACLNGGAPGLYIEQADGSRQYLVCEQPYEVSWK